MIGPAGSISTMALVTPGQKSDRPGIGTSSGLACSSLPSVGVTVENSSAVLLSGKVTVGPPLAQVTPNVTVIGAVKFTWVEPTVNPPPPIVATVQPTTAWFGSCIWLLEVGQVPMPV